MSRIDEALKLSEGAGAEPPQRPDGKPAASPLNQYFREGSDRAGDGEPRGLRPVERDKSGASADGRAGDVRESPALDDDLGARLVTGTTNTVSLEQYRRLAAVLYEEQAEDQLSTVMVTSAVPGEGKTLTVVNLALTLSESYGRRVLIIDADLRVPSVHTALGIRNERGLSEALRDADTDLPIRQVTGGLSVMTAGRSALNPLAGLSSPRMEEILREAAARFDWVLLDTSPVGVLPDAQVLARLAGGVILVIGAGSTPAAAVERAVAEVGGPDAIIGTVLNRIEQHRIPDAGYYGRYGNQP